MRALYLILIATATGACATSAVGNVRFKNEPVVWRVNDRNNLANKPAERIYFRTLYHVDGFVVRRLTRAMEARKSRRAQNVNALDEVPDSTWWTNRIGVRDLTLDEIRQGPNLAESPEAHKPWTITRSKPGGTAVGFIMKDARGDRFLLKFDHPRGPEMETAADIIVQRLLWACGYNVPEDSIVEFARDDLLLAEDASIKDVFGNKMPMTLAHLEEGLAKVGKRPDGSYRGLVSKYLPGIPIGPWSREGRRGDDPNDRIPHEDRRELRGAYSIFAWLNHTDLQEDNTLDMWHEDKATGTRYVKHYFIDFGKALGVMGFVNKWRWPGHTYRVDLSFMAKGLLAFGLWKRPHEDVSDPAVTGVGIIGVRDFDPGRWRPNSIYWPLEDKDRFDAFWGAKVIIRLSEAHIRTAVQQGKLSDAKAVDYLTKTLVARQRKTARYWFRKVAPLDRFEVSGDQLCFEDLSVRYQLGGTSGTRYQVDGFDKRGHPIGLSATATAGPAGRVCVGGPSTPRVNDSYAIVRVRTMRGATELPSTEVHLAKDPRHHKLRVIGLRRN